MLSITTGELLQVIGEKEIEIRLLTRQLMAAQQELAKLRGEAEAAAGQGQDSGEVEAAAGEGQDICSGFD